MLDEKIKKSEMIYKKLAGDSRSQYQTALDNKERILDYDANSAKRTQLIDDESDYFSVDSNMWLTPQKRESQCGGVASPHVRAGTPHTADPRTTSQTQVFSLIWMNIWGGRGVVTKISEVPLA